MGNMQAKWAFLGAFGAGSERAGLPHAIAASLPHKEIEKI
jgi:hypothetical protein